MHFTKSSIVYRLSSVVCFLLLCSAALASSTTTFEDKPNSYWGKQAVVRKLIITVTPTAADINSISSTATTTEPIYGRLRRITLKASGTDTAFSVTVKDGDVVKLFEKTDCNTAQMPVSYSLYTNDVNGYPQEDIIVAGLLTFDTNDVDPNSLTTITATLYYENFRQ